MTVPGGRAPGGRPVLRSGARWRIIIGAFWYGFRETARGAVWGHRVMVSVSARMLVVSVAIFAAWLAPPALGDGGAPAANLRAQIEALAAVHGFRLEGARRIEQAPPVRVTGSLDERIMDLLTDHDFAIVRDGNGIITKVLVSGIKNPPPDPAIRVSVKTVRRGTGHYLDAVIMGRRPVRLKVSLLVDTGASMIVLPSSMMDDLGYTDSDLTDAVLQTANGEIPGRTGLLRHVEVGRAVSRDVAVAFVDDERLGDKMILGMSFLSRYVIIINDAANVLSLIQVDQ